MASTTTLRNGSSGSDVKKLQKALISAGYDVGSTGADGVFGKNTAAAVKAYQKDNGLAVDGIAGKNTLGALNGTGNTAKKAPKATAPATKAKTVADTSDPDIAPKAKAVPVTADNSDPDVAPAPVAVLKPYTYEDFSYDKQFSYDDFNYSDFSYADYAESDTVKQANALLQQQIASKPGEYQSQWQNQINDYMNRIENRDPFSYDFNNDALYQLYKDNYIQQGQMAMMDTMGQAATMTGGYGNSYAQTVGQQAYNQQLNQLNDVIPELAQLAHDQYAYEGQQLADMYNMYLDRENQDYGRYQTDLGNWYNELEYLTNRYDSERNFDYNKYQTDRNQAYNQYTSDRNLAYDQYSTNRNTAYNEFSTDREMAYNNWANEVDMGFKNYQTALQNHQWQTEMAEDQRRYEQEWEAKQAATAEDQRRYDQEWEEELRRYNQEWDAKQEALATKPSGSPAPAKPTYLKLEVGSDAYKMIVKEIENATTLDQLKSITNTYLAMGYDPAVVNAMTGSKANSLKNTPIVDTTVVNTQTDPNTEWQKTHKFGGGMGKDPFKEEIFK